MPGAKAEYINTLLHTEPYSFIFHGCVWSVLLLFACPLAGWILLIITLGKLCIPSLKDSKIVNVKKSGYELAVYITGCDTGFGKGLTFALAAKGFTVFCGCLTETGMKQYEGIDGIIPLKVDVSKDKDSADAASSVSKWLHDPSAKSSRFLHAVFCNAGIGAPGLIDWRDVSTYQKVMNVNFYGMIRTVKAFLPLLKAQIRADTYTNARIINMSSVSGIFSGSVGSSVYAGSKHAVEAFSSCLRLELQEWNIAVTTVNPSSHSTGLVSVVEIDLKKSWENLSADKKEDYGEEYFADLLKAVDKIKQISWNPKYVEDALVFCAETNNPKPQVLVGLDAQFFILPLTLLPKWIQVKILTAMSSKTLPACMQ